LEICSAGPFSAAAADGLTGQAADLIRRSLSGLQKTLTPIGVQTID
jgi:hypothetical protein